MTGYKSKKLMALSREDDLVKRLRDKVAASRIYDDDEELLDEAADRIEALEAALWEKDNIDYIIDSHGIAHNTFTIVYRAALGEKKDGH